MLVEPAGSLLVLLAPWSGTYMERMKLCGVLRVLTWRGTSSVSGRRRRRGAAAAGCRPSATPPAGRRSAASCRSELWRSCSPSSVQRSSENREMNTDGTTEERRVPAEGRQSRRDETAPNRNCSTDFDIKAQILRQQYGGQILRTVKSTYHRNHVCSHIRTSGGLHEENHRV